jgi:hypothetical protein
MGTWPDMIRQTLRGAAAGAAGTTVLNAVTYLDMAWRGRPASTTPQQSIERLSEQLGVDVPGDGEQRDNRTAALGSLLGLLTGVGVGAVYGALRGLGVRPGRWPGALLASGAALVAANAPMTLLGVTDPRSWSLGDWVSDVVPHLAYGTVTALTYGED